MKTNSIKKFNLIIAVIGFVYFLVLLLDAYRRPVFMDEMSFQRNVLHFLFYKTMVPVYVNYPTFYSYLITPPIYIGYLISYVLKGLPPSGIFDRNLFAFIYQADHHLWVWIARIISISVATYIIARIAKYSFTNFKFIIALFSVFIIFCDPFEFYMTHANYALPDIFIAAFSLLILLLCLKFLEFGNWKYLNIASFCVGLAASLKLNGVFLILPLFVMPFYKINHAKKILSNLRIIFLFLFGFALGSPFMVIKPEHYANGFLFEKQLLLGQGSFIDSAYDPLWIFSSFWSKSPTICFIILLSIVYSMVKRTPRDIISLVLLIPSIFIMGLLDKKADVYFIFLYPILVIQSAHFLNSCYIKFYKDSIKRNLFFGFLIVTSLMLFLTLINRLIVSGKPDNRDLARVWIYENLPKDSTFLLDWGYMPEIGLRDYGILIDTNTIDVPYKKYLKKQLSKILYQFFYLEDIGYNVKKLDGVNVNYLITSNACYDRYLMDNPSSSSIFIGQDTKINYIRRGMFYKNLFRGKLGFKGFRTFSSGSGPIVNIFRKDY